jgi:hypothetical protein
MEGDHFCGRPRNSASAIGNTLHAIGESLRLSVGPYNRPSEGQTFSRSVSDSGLLQRVDRDDTAYQVQLRRSFERDDEHAFWVWMEGHSAPDRLPDDDWIQEEDVCLIQLPDGARPVAFALSFEGAWLGARTCQRGWQGFADLIGASSDWVKTAAWLRWWRVPVRHENLKEFVNARVVGARIGTLSAWTSSAAGPCSIARFSEGHEDAWHAVTRSFLWDWKPSDCESAAVLRNFGMLVGDHQETSFSEHEAEG